MGLTRKELEGRSGMVRIWRNKSGGPIRFRPRIKRNDKCPCGSGRKFKKCCMGRKAGETENA